jgi:hypothetical protein
MSASTPQASGTTSMNADQGVPPGIFFFPHFLSSFGCSFALVPVIKSVDMVCFNKMIFKKLTGLE